MVALLLSQKWTKGDNLFVINVLFIHNTISPRVLVSAAHCFNDKYKDSDWFVRVGDNYIAEDDPSEQTFQVTHLK